MELINVLLVDDHPMLRQSLARWLEGKPGVAVVGEAGDGRTAVAMAAELRPDICVMDVSMPGLSGVEATRRLAKGRSRTRVIAVTQHEDPAVVADMLEAGAMGYVLKSDGADELLRAVMAVAAGRRHLSPSISDCLVEPFLSYHRSGDGSSRAMALSGREREVVQLVAEGHTTREIAALLELSVRTVESHRHKIMGKLGLRTVAGLTKWAIRNRLTTVDG